MTPEEQITWTITTLKDTLARKGWPNVRQHDLQALVTQLETQWQAYQAGTLVALDPTVEV